MEWRNKCDREERKQYYMCEGEILTNNNLVVVCSNYEMTGNEEKYIGMPQGEEREESSGFLFNNKKESNNV